MRSISVALFLLFCIQSGLLTNAQECIDTPGIGCPGIVSACASASACMPEVIWLIMTCLCLNGMVSSSSSSSRSISLSSAPSAAYSVTISWSGPSLQSPRNRSKCGCRPSPRRTFASAAAVPFRTLRTATVCDCNVNLVGIRNDAK